MYHYPGGVGSQSEVADYESRYSGPEHQHTIERSSFTEKFHTAFSSIKSKIVSRVDGLLSKKTEDSAPVAVLGVGLEQKKVEVIAQEEVLEVPVALGLDEQIKRVRAWVLEGFSINEGVGYPKEAKIIGLLHKTEEECAQYGIVLPARKEAIFLEQCAKAFMEPNEISLSAEDYYKVVSAEKEEDMLFSTLHRQLDDQWSFKNKELSTLEISSKLIDVVSADLTENFDKNTVRIKRAVATAQDVLLNSKVLENSDKYCTRGVTLEDYVYALVLAQCEPMALTFDELPLVATSKAYFKVLWVKVELIMGAPSFAISLSKNIEMKKLITQSVKEVQQSVDHENVEVTSSTGRATDQQKKMYALSGRIKGKDVLSDKAK